MSNRTLIEINHDVAGLGPEAELGAALKRFIRSGDARWLPQGFTFFHHRHHTEDCPMGEPPFGWDNLTPRTPEER